MNRRPATIVTVAVLLAMGVLSWWAAPRLPEQVPVHWNFSGEPDRYGSVAEALLTPPLIVVALSVLLWFVPNLDPRGEHIRRSARAYNALWIAVVLLMLVVHATTVLGAATSADIPVVSIVPAALGLFFIVFGVYLPKTSSNWFIGIRTPWTLTSELAWRRTHLLGGILFVVLGAMLIAVGLFAEGAAAVLAGAGAMVIAVVTMAYSYMVWRGDPARRASDPASS